MADTSIFKGKTKIVILLATVLSVASCELLSGYVLMEAEKKRFNQWYANDFLPSNFKDTIHSIYDYSTIFEKKIVINVFDRNSYGNLCVSEETIDFIRRGDSIIKIKDKPIFIIKKSDGRIHSFETRFCQ